LILQHVGKLGLISSDTSRARPSPVNENENENERCEQRRIVSTGFIRLNVLRRSVGHRKDESRANETQL
jgi:hypothetical protein